MVDRALLMIYRVINDTSRSIIDDSRVMLHIVKSLTIVMCDCSMFMSRELAAQVSYAWDFLMFFTSQCLQQLYLNQYAECCFAEFTFFIVMLDVIILSVVVPNVVMLNVTLYLLLYWVSLCLMSLCWMLLCSMSRYIYCCTECHYVECRGAAYYPQTFILLLKIFNFTSFF